MNDARPTAGLTRGRAALAAAVLSGALLLAACGSSASSTAKPAFCSNVTALKKSISDLPTAVTGGVSSLKTQLTTIEGQVASIVPSAKSDFPSETQALSNSLATLETQIKHLSASPTVPQIAAVGLQAENTVKAAQSLITATKSKCS